MEKLYAGFLSPPCCWVGTPSMRHPQSRLWSWTESYEENGTATEPFSGAAMVGVLAESACGTVSGGGRGISAGAGLSWGLSGCLALGDKSSHVRLSDLPGDSRLTSFKFVQVWIMVQDTVQLYMLHGCVNVHTALAGWSVLSWLIRFCGLTVLLSSSIFLLTFCLVVLSIVEKGVLHSPTIIVDLSSVPFKFYW